MSRLTKYFQQFSRLKGKYRVNCHNFKLKTRRKHKHRKRHKPGCTGFSETVLDNSLMGRKWFDLSYRMCFQSCYVMITHILYNLYISGSEESKIEFSPHLYASEKCKKTFPWNLLWQTICLIAAAYLMWALDTKQIPQIGNDNRCLCQSLSAAGDYDLLNPECLSPSVGL